MFDDQAELIDDNCLIVEGMGVTKILPHGAATQYAPPVYE